MKLKNVEISVLLMYLGILLLIPIFIIVLYLFIGGEKIIDDKHYKISQSMRFDYRIKANKNELYNVLFSTYHYNDSIRKNNINDSIYVTELNADYFNFKALITIHVDSINNSVITFDSVIDIESINGKDSQFIHSVINKMTKEDWKKCFELNCILPIEGSLNRHDYNRYFGMIRYNDYLGSIDSLKLNY